MPLTSPRANAKMTSVPTEWGDEADHRRQIASTLNVILGAARFDANGGGRVLVGTTSNTGSSRLVVNQPDAGEKTVSLDNVNATPGAAIIAALSFPASSPDNNTAKFISCTDATTERLRVYSDGDVQNHDNSYGAISSRSVKQDIEPLPSRWDAIKALRLRQYRMREDVAKLGEAAPTRFGLVFDEAKQDAPRLTKGEDFIIYSHLYLEAVGALQEAMARIEALEAKVGI